MCGLLSRRSITILVIKRIYKYAHTGFHAKPQCFHASISMNMTRLALIVLFEVITRLFATSDHLQDLEVKPKFVTPCVTPNKDIGACVEIQKCLIFMEALRLGKNDNYDFIRESECGPPNEDRKQPKVCCGKYDNYLDKVTIVIPTTAIPITAIPTTAIPTTATTQTVNTPQKDVFPKTCRGRFDRVRVFGGVEAKLGEFPWMARLRHRRSDDLLSYGCSGFLISAQFVLTAAHCVRSKILEPLGPIYQVQLGEHNTETDPDCLMEKCADPPQLLKVAEPIVHTGYSGDHQQYNDIAIIPLKEAAQFTDYVYPICLPTTLSQVPNMIISGWGKTELRPSSHIKLKVAVPKTNHTHCVAMYKPIGIKILDSQLCAGGEAGRDSCSGDSGGPIMVYDPTSGWYAEGIVSFGKGCGLDGWPGVYTSIPYYMPWIQMAMNEHSKPQGEENEDNRTEVKEDYFIWGL